MIIEWGSLVFRLYAPILACYFGKGRGMWGSWKLTVFGISVRCKMPGSLITACTVLVIRLLDSNLSRNCVDGRGNLNHGLRLCAGFWTLTKPGIVVTGGDGLGILLLF